MQKITRNKIKHLAVNIVKALRTTHREYLYGLMLMVSYMSIVLIWRSIDQRPPNWDMARHLYTAEVYARLLSEYHWLDLIWQYMYYPPILYIWAAKWQTLFGHSVVSAVASNVLWVGMTIGSMIAIGRSLRIKYAGLLGSVFFFTMPLVGSVVRDYQIDIPLTAMVALTLALLIRSKRFTSFNWSLFCGICFGLGMLTKWTYPAFVALPAVIVMLAGLSARRDRRVVLQNIITSLAVGVVIAQPWYVRNIDAVRGDFQANGAAAGVNEGDPTVLSFAGLFWYPRAILREYLWLPWLAPVVAALAHAVKSRSQGLSLETLVLLSSSLGGLLCFTLLRNKDARYIMPIFIGVSIWAGVQLASWLHKNSTQILTGVIGALITLSYLATSFLSLNANFALGPLTWWRSTGYITGSPERAQWCQEDAFVRAQSYSPNIRSIGLDTIWYNGWGNSYYAIRDKAQSTAAERTIIIERSLVLRGNTLWSCQNPDQTWVNIYWQE